MRAIRVLVLTMVAEMLASRLNEPKLIAIPN